MLKLGQYTIQDFIENEVLDAFLQAYSNTYNYINQFYGIISGTTVAPNTEFRISVNGTSVTIKSDGKCNWKYESDDPIESIKRMAQNNDVIRTIDFTHANMYITVSDALSSAFNSCSNLEKVTGLQSIKCDPNGSYDLSGMFRMTKIEEFTGFHQSFGSVTITDVTGMFYRCVKLTHADISSIKIDGCSADQMFNGCGAMTTVKFSTFNPSSTTEAFTHGTNKVENFYIDDLGTSLDLSNMQKLSLESVTNLMKATRIADDNQYTYFDEDYVIPYILSQRPAQLIEAYAESIAGGWTYNFNFGNKIIVTTHNPGDTFHYTTPDGTSHEVTSDADCVCTIELTDLTSLKNLFSSSDCSCIYGINMSGLDTYGVKDISGMCTGCTELHVSAWGYDHKYAYANVEDADHAFANVGVPGGLWFDYDMPACQDASYMFANSSMFDIQMPAYPQGCDTHNIVSGCDDLTSVTIRVGNKASLDLSEHDLTSASIQNLLESCSVTTVTDSPTISFSAATEQILDRKADLIALRDDAIIRGWVFTNVPIEYTYLTVKNADNPTQFDPFITDDGNKIRLQ